MGNTSYGSWTIRSFCTKFRYNLHLLSPYLFRKLMPVVPFVSEQSTENYTNYRLQKGSYGSQNIIRSFPMKIALMLSHASNCKIFHFRSSFHWNGIDFSSENASYMVIPWNIKISRQTFFPTPISNNGTNQMGNSTQNFNQNKTFFLCVYKQSRKHVFFLLVSLYVI